MSESISRQTALAVAKLARIHLSEADAEQTQDQLSSMLGYVSQLNAAEICADIQPFFGAVEAVNAIRDDVVQPSFPRDIILHNAPDSDGEFYRVPPVF